MSLSVPSRRLLRGAPALTATPTTTTSSFLPALQSLSLGPNTNTPASSRPIHTTPSNRWFWNRNKGGSQDSAVEQQMTGTKDARQAFVKSLANRIEGPAIFEDERKETTSQTDPSTTTTTSGPGTDISRSASGASLVREHLGRAADPDPRSRARWERKMVIRQVQRGTNPYSREPRAEVIARTERQVTSKSDRLATSTKKLVMLARQIQGKTVSDALTQMRFSKKKMAREVRYQLELARAAGIVERGMGLGEAAAKANKAQKDGAAAAASEVQGEAVRESSDFKTVEIRTKDGKWVKVDDPTRMYVAEAWVNRGPWRGKEPEYRARGRMNIIKKPSASITIVLKEEKTRIREAAEREAKKLRQGPWVHLPDRPVTAQRQWYSW